MRAETLMEKSKELIQGCSSLVNAVPFGLVLVANEEMFFLSFFFFFLWHWALNPGLQAC
jgi:hypothetical protein